MKRRGDLTRELVAFTACYSFYHLDICTDTEENKNFIRLVNQPTTRQALHVGNTPFVNENDDVYAAVRGDIMKSELENLEFLLDKYRVFQYKSLACLT